MYDGLCLFRGIHHTRAVLSSCVSNTLPLLRSMGVTHAAFSASLNQATPSFESRASCSCPGGTHADQTIINADGYLSSLAQCLVCQEGTFCPVGSSSATDCAAGTFNNLHQQETCRPCAAGTYQSATGATECLACLQGSFCPAGASAPLPCPEGSFSTKTDNDEASDCTIADAGSYAPTGSKAQIACSPSSAVWRFFLPLLLPRAWTGSQRAHLLIFIH